MLASSCHAAVGMHNLGAWYSLFCTVCCLLEHFEELCVHTVAHLLSYQTLGEDTCLMNTTNDYANNACTAGTFQGQIRAV